MRVVLDLNVALDVLLSRDEFLESAEVLLLAAAGKFEAIFPLHGITTIFYFCRKQMPEQAARKHLLGLLDAVRVFSISEEDVLRAIQSPVPDFEDAVVAETANKSQSQYILTRDKAGFTGSLVPAITPSEFLDKFFRERR